MTAGNTADWSAADRQLWARLQAHPFEDPSRPLDFCARLARDHGWTRTQARAAIDEYRRFCFLCCVERGEMTPSVAVDEVWHLHLTFSRDYWLVFCADVLGMPLHHGPTAGTAGDGVRYREQYGDTLRAYQRWFGEAPPLHGWPTRHERFRRPQRYQWIDRERVWVLPKRAPGPLARAAVALLACALPGAASASVFDWPAGPFLQSYALAGLLALLLGGIIRRSARHGGHARLQPPLDLLQTAFLGGGAERCADAAVAALLSDGHAQWNNAARRLELVGTPPAGALEATARVIAAGGSTRTMIQRIARQQQPLGTTLAARGLCLDRPQARRASLLSALPLCLVVFVGLYRIDLGIERGRPVGYLIALTVLFAMIALWMVWRRPHRTRAGDAHLADLRRQNRIGIRAPRREDLALAVALAGTSVLADTAFAGYYTARYPSGATSSGGDGGGDSSSSDSSDGGGGSGCGGCGGGD